MVLLVVVAVALVIVLAGSGMVLLRLAPVGPGLRSRRRAVGFDGADVGAPPRPPPTPEDQVEWEEWDPEVGTRARLLRLAGLVLLIAAAGVAAAALLWGFGRALVDTLIHYIPAGGE